MASPSSARLLYRGGNASVCRVHQNLRVTPAMEALLSDHVWSIEEMIALLDRRSAVAA